MWVCDPRLRCACDHSRKAGTGTVFLACAHALARLAIGVSTAMPTPIRLLKIEPVPVFPPTSSPASSTSRRRSFSRLRMLAFARRRKSASDGPARNLRASPWRGNSHRFSRSAERPEKSGGSPSAQTGLDNSGTWATINFREQERPVFNTPRFAAGEAGCVAARGRSCPSPRQRRGTS